MELLFSIGDLSIKFIAENSARRMIAQNIFCIYGQRRGRFSRLDLEEEKTRPSLPPDTPLSFASKV
jgi:hypothetical protein